MKKLCFCCVCFFSLFTFNCVDYIANTYIEVVNESSYNLKINFERIPPFTGFDEEINIMMDESVSFVIPTLGGKDVEPGNPNGDVIKIIFTNSDTNEIIKEVDNMRKDIVFFEFSRGEKYDEWYRFKINDDFDWTLKW